MMARIGDHSAPLDEHGVFVLSFELDEPGLLDLDVGGTIPMFLAPGDRIDLHTRGDDVLGALQWKGANAHVNQFLVDEAKRRAAADSLFGLPREAFLERSAQLEAAANERLEAFLAAHHAVPLAFEPLERAAIRARWAEVRSRYDASRP